MEWNGEKQKNFYGSSKFGWAPDVARLDAGYEFSEEIEYKYEREMQAAGLGTNGRQTDLTWMQDTKKDSFL